MQTLSIDFCGTLDKNTAFWKEMLGYIKLEGIRIYVISGLWPNQLEDRLESFGFNRKLHYDDTYSIFGYLTAEGIGIWFNEDQDSWKTDPKTWWCAKAAICKKINSWVHLDNDLRFGSAFSNTATRFIYLEDYNGKSEIVKWRDQLKLANTYEDWEDDYMYMSGIIPM